VIGIVQEQGPAYFRHGRSAGLNGGVQLHRLAHMRSSTNEVPSTQVGTQGTYEEALQQCAAGGCKGWDAVEPSLGDQTLYTRLCAKLPQLCHILPCGWNRQLSTKYYSVPGFKTDWHSCQRRCELLHFNQPLLESMVPELQALGSRVTCADCQRGIQRVINHTREHPSRNPRFTWGASKQYMGSIIDSCCCSGGIVRI